MKCTKRNGIAAFKRFICDLYLFSWCRTATETKAESVWRNSTRPTSMFLITASYVSPCLPAGRQKIVNSTTWWIDWRYRERDGRTDQYQCVCFFYVTFFPVLWYDAVSSIKLTFQTRLEAWKLKKKQLCFELFPFVFSGGIWEVCSK